MDLMSEYRWVYTTWPDAQTAQEAAARLVSERLCACANILPGMTSVYEWEGQVETASETAMALKTTTDRIAALQLRFHDLHPYDEPCFLALTVDTNGSARSFLDWISASTRMTVF